MSRLLATVLLAIAVIVALSGCAGAGGDRGDELVSDAPALAGAQARPAAPLAAGTLATVADGRRARQRLAYVNVAALRAAELPVPADDVARAVLGRGAARLNALRAGAATTVVQVGSGATILRGPGVEAVEGSRSGADGVVVGAGRGLAARLADTRPEQSAITPVAQSAVQSCLGETLAQTILGPESMGRDAALGVGIAAGGDSPEGIQLRVCGAPHFLRHVHAMKHTLRTRFGELDAGRRRGARIEEREVGEREMVAAVVAADALSAKQLLRLLAAGPELRELAWR